MATADETVRRLTIELTSTGLDETTAKLNKLSGAQDGVKVSSSGAEKATTSMQSRLNSLQKSLDTEYASEAKLASIRKTLDASLQQGLVTQQRYNQLLDLASAKYKTAGESAKFMSDSLVTAKDAALGFIGGIGAGILIGSLTELPAKIAETVENLAKVGDVAQTIGTTTKALQEMRYAAQLADVQTSTLDAAMQKFSTNLGKPDSQLNKLFAANGVKVTGDTLTDLEHFADLVKNASTQEERNAIVSEAMGKSAQEMGRLFSEGSAGIAEWTDQAQAAGAVISDAKIEQAKELNDQLTALKPALVVAQTQFAVLIEPALLSGLADLNKALTDINNVLVDIGNHDLGKLFQDAMQPEHKASLLDGLNLPFAIDWDGTGSAITGNENLVTGKGAKSQDRDGFMAPPSTDNLGTAPSSFDFQSFLNGVKPTVIPSTATDEAQKKIDKETKSLKDQAAALTMTSRQQAELNALTEAGITVNDKSAPKIVAEADALYDQRKAVEAVNQAQQFLATSAADAFISVVDGSSNAADAVKGLVKALEDAALQALLLGQGPLAGLLGTTPTTSGGLGGLGGLLAGLFTPSTTVPDLGLSDGGYTGNRATSQVAGVVHGKEFVFSAPATARLGVGNLDRLHRQAKGYAGGGYVAPMASNANWAAPANRNDGGGNGKSSTTVNVHFHGVTDMPSFQKSRAQVTTSIARAVGGAHRYS